MSRYFNILISFFIGAFILWPVQADAEESTLRAMLGQMVIVGFRGQDIRVHDQIAKDIAAGRVGGVILFDYDSMLKKGGRNIADPEQLKGLVARLKSMNPIPMFVSIDQEGGKVARLKKSNGFREFPSAEIMGRESSTKVMELGEDMGRMLYSYGINLDFAPVVDLNINPKNPAVGALGRSFSASSKVVTEKAGAFLSGMQSRGVLGCLKHFPGHGSASVDSHLGLTDISQSWSETELEPYQKLIAASQVHMIMVGHLFNAKLDPDYPASMSHKIMTGLLREKLGFTGVIATDDMQMKAITEQYGLKEAVEQAVLGGADLLVFGNNLDYDPLLPLKVQDILINMFQDGRLSRERVEASVRRVVDLKNSWLEPWKLAQ